MSDKNEYRRVARLHPNARMVTISAPVRFEMVKGEDGKPSEVGAWVKVYSGMTPLQSWGRSVKGVGSNGWEIFISGAEARAGELS
jgi:hypothetical protein